MRRSLFPLAVTAALVACVPAADKPTPVAPPRPEATVALPSPPAGTDWRDWPVTPGTWRYARDDLGNSVATFGSGSRDYRLRLECRLRSGRLSLVTAGVPGAPPLTIRTTSLVRTVSTRAISRPDDWPPMTRDVDLPAADPLLDAMAFSRGHFTIEEAGRPALVVPAWPEIGRVVEDCRV